MHFEVSIIIFDLENNIPNAWIKFYTPAVRVPLVCEKFYLASKISFSLNLSIIVVIDFFDKNQT